MMQKLHVIIADNQQSSATLCTNYLLKHNMHVVQTHTLHQLKHELSRTPVDILLFDLQQNDGDGMSFIQNLGFQNAMGVIVFTHSYDLIDKFITLETCADDFIQKPCNFREVVARIRAIHRRIQWNKKQDSTNVYCHDFVMNRLLRTVTLNSGKKLDLTRHEFDVLNALVSHKERPMSRQILIDAISNYTSADQVTFRAIDSVIYRLRNKFPKENAIKTVYGVGYVFQEPTKKLLTPHVMPFYNTATKDNIETKKSIRLLAKQTTHLLQAPPKIPKLSTNC